jgi:hypothetical protein
MRTEAARSFGCGFALNESELRRLHDVLVQQIKRTAVGEDAHSFYELKFRNGAVACPVSIDDVLSQENFGSGSIVRLKLDVTGSDDEKSANRIAVEFTNCDEEQETSSDGVRYRILGGDRDWVFVTSSQIEERIAKLRIFSLNQLVAGRRSVWAYTVPLLFLMLMMVALWWSERQHVKTGVAEVQKVETDWKSGALKDPAEVIIWLEKIRITGPSIPNILIVVLPLAGIVLFPAFGYVYTYLAPPYNFLWGGLHSCI